MALKITKALTDIIIYVILKALFPKAKESNCVKLCPDSRFRACIVLPSWHSICDWILWRNGREYQTLESRTKQTDKTLQQHGLPGGCREAVKKGKRRTSLKTWPKGDTTLEDEHVFVFQCLELRMSFLKETLKMMSSHTSPNRKPILDTDVDLKKQLYISCDK